MQTEKVLFDSGSDPDQLKVTTLNSDSAGKGKVPADLKSGHFYSASVAITDFRAL